MKNEEGGLARCLKPVSPAGFLLDVTPVAGLNQMPSAFKRMQIF